MCLLVTGMPAAASGYTWTGGHVEGGVREAAGEWTLAEGCTRSGFDTWLCLANPGDADASVHVEYLLAGAAPVARDYPVAARSRATLLVDSEVGEDQDLGFHVTSTVPVVVERSMYFNYHGAWTGGHVEGGVREAAGEWTLAEGCTRSGFDTWLCLANPGDADASVHVEYLLAGAAPVARDYPVAARSRATLLVDSEVGEDQDLGFHVTSTVPVVVERSMYFNYHGAWTGGHVEGGVREAAGEWTLAEGCTRSGFDTWLCLANPGDAEASVHVEYLLAGAAPVARDYPVAARSRATLLVDSEVGEDQDLGFHVTSTVPVVVERSMYFNYHGAWTGGHVEGGVREAAGEWTLAEGCTRSGFDTWLCLANPGDAEASVHVEYLLAGAAPVARDYPVAARSRATLLVDSEVGEDQDLGFHVTSTVPVVVERSMYFNYGPSPSAGEFPLAVTMERGIRLSCPITYPELTGVLYHEASVYDSDNRIANALALQPLGGCLDNGNPSHAAAGLQLTPYGDPFFWVEETRYRGTASTTCIDVGARAGSEARAPVTGTVVEAKAYLLYGAYPDNRVKIQPDGQADLVVAVLHLGSTRVGPGDRVKAGVTVVGTVNDLARYFRSDLADYNHDDGNHVHIQVNRPE